MKKYFALDKYPREFDELTQNMQEAIIGIFQKRLQTKLSDDLVESIRKNPRSYLALEMNIEHVQYSELNELEQYLSRLK